MPIGKQSITLKNMNRIKSIVASLMLSVVPVVIIPPVLIITATSITGGCKTSERTIAYKSVASLHAAVSAALTAWADYVIAERKRIAEIPDFATANAATSSLALQEVRVRAALQHYQQAGELAKLGVKVANSDNKLPPPLPVLDAGENFINTVANISR